MFKILFMVRFNVFYDIWLKWDVSPACLYWYKCMLRWRDGDPTKPNFNLVLYYLLKYCPYILNLRWVLMSWIVYLSFYHIYYWIYVLVVHGSNLIDANYVNHVYSLCYVILMVNCICILFIYMRRRTYLIVCTRDVSGISTFQEKKNRKAKHLKYSLAESNTKSLNRI
jgi:hypothetical protein